jgi:hypothetical protein
MQQPVFVTCLYKGFGQVLTQKAVRRQGISPSPDSHRSHARVSG